MRYFDVLSQIDMESMSDILFDIIKNDVKSSKELREVWSGILQKKSY